jgi:hypothetical protein
LRMFAPTLAANATHNIRSGCIEGRRAIRPPHPQRPGQQEGIRPRRGTTFGRLRCRGSSEPALPRLGHSRDGDRHATLDLHDWHNAFSRDVRCGRPGRRAARRLPSDCRPNERGTGPVHLRGTELLLVRLRLARAGILLVRLCDAPRPRMGWWGGLAWLAPRGSSRRTHWQR